MDRVKASMSSRRSLPSWRPASAKLTPEIIRNVELSTRFKPKEIRKLHQQFLDISDRNGLLGPDGFRQSMGILGMVQDSILCQRLFSVFNESQTGAITFEEYAKGLGILVKGTVDEKLTFAFAMTDIDGSGEITLKELEITVDSIMRIYSVIMGSINNAILDRSKIRKMFNQLDRNHDGMITLEEYKRGMKLHPEFVSSLRGSDLFTVGQNNIIKLEQSKVRRFKRVTNSILRDATEGLEILEELKDLSFDNAFCSRPSSRPSSPASEATILSDDYCDSDDEIGGFVAEPPKTPENTIDGRPSSIRTDGSPWRPSMSKMVPPEDRLVAILQTIKVKAQTVLEENALVSKQHHYSQTSNTATALGRPSQIASIKSSGLKSGSKPASLEIDQDFIMDSLLNSPTHEADGKTVGWDEATLQRENQENGIDEGDGLLGRYLSSASKGSTVFFGHKNWDLVLNVMKGIQMAVGRTSAESSRNLNDFDWTVKEKYTLVAGAKMGKHSVSRTQQDLEDIDSDRSGRSCRFVDYAPLVYCKLREHFGIKNEEYVHSIGPGNMLTNLMLGSLSSLAELGSEGKSGSFFYFTSDGKFMVKTVHRDEHKLLRSNLRLYYYHMIHSEKDSLLCRIVGCHVVRLSKNSKIGANKIYFVVMTNMLNTDLHLERRFDLKGSWVGRKSAEGRDNPKTTLKDVDFTEMKAKIRIGEERKVKLMAALKRDAEFLERLHIIDYSLLLGIHKHGTGNSTSSLNDSFHSGSRHFSGSTCSSTSSVGSISSMDEIEEERRIPFFQEDNGGMCSVDSSETYVMGIIDFFTLYGTRKVVERFGKSCLVYHNREGISVQPPSKYAKRFINFMDSIIE